MSNLPLHLPISELLTSKATSSCGPTPAFTQLTHLRNNSRVCGYHYSLAIITHHSTDLPSPTLLLISGTHPSPVTPTNHHSSTAPTTPPVPAGDISAKRTPPRIPPPSRQSRGSMYWLPIVQTTKFKPSALLFLKTRSGGLGRMCMCVRVCFFVFGHLERIE